MLSGNGTYIALNGDKYTGGFRRGTVVGPGVITKVSIKIQIGMKFKRDLQVNGDITTVDENESVEVRTGNNKYWDLLVTLGQYIGLSKIFSK